MDCVDNLSHISIVKNNECNIWCSQNQAEGLIFTIIDSKTIVLTVRELKHLLLYLVSCKHNLSIDI